ncbi:hypothetical protein V1508DRAFT_403383 [Lipomyces doorenjongii]|uniref:uncharacterized protein n=1 Tax=Lipomyces doorenjongii TaxID=383834 RepID=UPI0034CD4FDF
MDAVLAGPSTNSRPSLSRARSTTTRNSASPSAATRDKHAPAGKRSTTGVLSTMSVRLSTDMSPATEEKELSDYDQALYLLENNPPERRLDFYLPYSRYLKLQECWSKIKSARYISEDQKYPYLAYNSCAEYVTVVTVRRDLHEIAVWELGIEIINGARKYLSSQRANASLASRILPVGSTTTKQADGKIKYKGPGAMNEVMIAIRLDTDAWIDGQHAKICILVCLDESSRFRNPRTRHENVGDVIGQCAAMVQVVTETVEKDTSLGYYGHIEYQGHKWVGNLEEALIEVWRVKKRHPTRYVSSVIRLNSNGQPCSHTLCGISFDGDLYVHSLRTTMVTTAEERYKDYISR